jgi:pentatricopeptide repeat protein
MSSALMAAEARGTAPRVSAHGSDGVSEDISGMVSSMLVELLWFYVGFIIIRYGLLSRVLPDAVAASICKSGCGFLLGHGFRRPFLVKKEAPPAHTVAAAARSIRSLAGKHPAEVLRAWRSVEACQDGSLPLEAMKEVVTAFLELEPDAVAGAVTTYIGQREHASAAKCPLRELVDVVVTCSAPKETRVLALDGISKTLCTLSTCRKGGSALEILLPAFAHCGDEERVELLFQQAQDAGRTPSEQCLTLVARGFVRSAALGCGKAALRWLRESATNGYEVPPQLVSEAFRAASSDGQQGCAALYHDMRGVGVFPQDCISCIVRDCVTQEDTETAKQVEKLALSVGAELSYSSRESLLKLDARSGDARSCELFEEMLEAGVHFTEGLCGALLARSAESHCIRLAELVGAYLRKRGIATLATYKAFMKVYACSGLYKKACSLFDQLVADGIQPDDIMQNCVVKFAAKCGRDDLKQEIVGKASGGGMQNYMWLFRAAGREGDLPKAFALLRELEALQHHGLDIAAYNSVIDACVVNNRMADALQIARKVERTGAANAVTYNTLVKGYCASGDLENARATIQRMVRLGLSPDSASYNCIVGAFARKGDVHSAWKVISDMEAGNVAIDCYTASIMMTAAKKARDPRDAECALSLLDMPGVSPCKDDVLFNTVLDACMSLRNTSRLAKAIREYEASNMQPSVHTCGLLIKAYSSLQRVSKSREVWDEMIERRGVLPNEITLSCMLDALVCAGVVNDALKLFRVWEPKIQVNTVIYSTLLKGFANSGDADGAMNLFRELKAKGVKMNLVAYTTLIDAQARVGYMKTAKELLKQMEADGCVPNTITYSTLVKGCCVNGDLAGAQSIFQEMRDRGLKADVVIFNTLLDGCIRHSDFQLADRLLEGMDSYEVKPSNFTLSIIIRMWGKRRQFDRAFEAVSFWGSGLRLDAQIGSSLISACLHADSLDRTVQVFEEMKTWKNFNGPDANTYGMLIAALIRSRRYRQAASLAEEAYGRSGDWWLERTSARALGGKAGGRRKGAAVSAKRDTGGLGSEMLRQLFNGLAEEPGLTEAVGRPLASTLRSAGFEIPPSVFEVGR